jgi:putative ABC transport system ATP-binding protein
MADPFMVELKKVEKSYPMGEVTVHALRGIDLDIASGEFVALLGPSGCGKTTTLNLIGGLDRPTSGKVIVQGQDIGQFNEARQARYRRQQVGFVFQFFNLIPTLTAAENVEFAIALTQHDHLEQKARQLLELVGIGEWADHFPAQLSGGQQQRVAIARALANHPSVLLCDEPTGNLDAETGRQVLGVIRDLNLGQGTTVVLVTHNTAITPIADRVVHLRDGSVDFIDQIPEPIPVAELKW